MPSTPSASPAAHPAASPEPLVVKPREARQLLAVGNTYLYELIGAGELDSFLDGRSRKITVESIRRYITRRLAPTDNGVSTNARPHRRGRPRKYPGHETAT
jgi:excisionase family DNA binding protein